MLTKLGYYLDKKGTRWDLVEFPHHNASEVPLIMTRCRDRHHELFFKTGKNIDTQKPAITEYLSKETHPELYL